MAGPLDGAAGVALPDARRIRADGAGFKSAAPAAKWWYWVATPLLLLCAFWVPLQILGWAPRAGNFELEDAQLPAAAALAYLLFGAAWLVLAFVTSAGRPRFTQPSTVGLAVALHQSPTPLAASS